MALRAHLFDELIPALIRARPPLPGRRHVREKAPFRPARAYSQQELRRWLTTLAEHIRYRESRDWHWWRLARHTFPTSAPTRLVIGLGGALLVGLAVVLTNAPVGGLAVALPGGLAFGLAGGLAFGLAIRLDAPPMHTHARLAGRGRQLAWAALFGLLVGLLSGMLVNLVVGLVVGLVIVMEVGLATGEAYGLAVGLAVGLAYGLFSFLGSEDHAARSLSPTRSYRGNRGWAVTKALIGGLATGVAAGCATVLVGGPSAGLTAGVAIGIIGALWGAMDTAWGAFTIAALFEAMHRPRRLPAPWRVMPMLEDCHRLGLMRTVGPAYQFRHAQLQDHLAPPNPS